MSEGGKAKVPQKCGTLGEAAVKAGKVVGLKSRSAQKLARIVDAAANGDVQAKANLQNDTTIDHAYKALPKPDTDSKIKETKKFTDDLTQLFRNAELSRSKTEGLFHLTLRDVTMEEIKQIAQILK